MKIIAHRGAAGLALENTLESIKAALKLPVYAIEIDVRRTADGELILLHDHHTGHVSKKNAAGTELDSGRAARANPP